MVLTCVNAFAYDDFHTNKSDDSRQFTAINAEIHECMLQLQAIYGRPLSKQDQQDIAHAYHILSALTGGEKLPRLFQIMATLDILNGRHTVVRAGTGSGKTIAMALSMLLRSEWLFITVAPLLALQNQHVCIQ